ERKRPVGSLPPSKPPTGPAPPQRSVCALGTMSLHSNADQNGMGELVMSFSNWLRNLQSVCRLVTTSRKNRRASRSGTAKPFRPHLEVLEDRALPSAFMVTNLLDSGAGSLREAVVAANANPGADTIDFATTGTIALTTGQLDITDSVAINGP